MMTCQQLHQILPRLDLSNLSLAMPQLAMKSVTCPTVLFGRTGGIKHMKLGWAGQQGSIGDSGQFNLWPFPVLPDLEVLREICKGNLSLKVSII